MRARLLFLLAGLLFIAGLSRDAFENWVDATDMPPLAIETSVEMLDREGQLMRAYMVADGRWRLHVPLNGVDPGYIAQLIAFEDKRFYDHAGVDPRAMLRAVTQAVRNGRIISGGSTLTMQVARLLENGPTGTWDGKLRQLRLALALEKRLSKDQILELYFNRAPYGGNLEGVRAATYAYFGKEPRRLTPAEAALLVALPQSPERRRPDRFHGAAVDARDRVLARMEGAGVLSEEDRLTAKTEPVPAKRIAFPIVAAHLADRLIAENPSAGAHLTTLDRDLQIRLEALAARAARDAGQKLSVAVVLANHKTGEILASVGSADYLDDQRDGFVDMTQAIRSPGSTLKPLVYGLAMDQGLVHPETLIEDRPADFAGYAPQNFDGGFRGTIKIRDALKLSLNIPVVKLTQAVGAARLMSHLRRAGLTPVIPEGKPGLAIALGGVGVDLQGLVQLFAAFPNRGKSVALHAVKADVPEPHQVLRPEAAWFIGDILGSIPAPRNAGRSGLAYKTGTSYGHRDAWAIGYDGAHVAGVWMGRPDGTPVPGAFGGDLAAPILFEAFSILKPSYDRLPAPPANTLLVSHARLPQPLKRFRSRDAALTATGGPNLAFPPDGARVELDGHALAVKVRDGVAPFTWLANGAPIVSGSFERFQMIPMNSKGFVTLSVIDANGQSARSSIRVD